MQYINIITLPFGYLLKIFLLKEDNLSAYLLTNMVRNICHTTLILLTLLSPESIFAMDPKVESGMAKGIIGGIKKYLGEEQQGIARYCTDIGMEEDPSFATVSAPLGNSLFSSSSCSSISISRFDEGSIHDQIQKVDAIAQEAQWKVKLAQESISMQDKWEADEWNKVLTSTQKTSQYWKKTIEMHKEGYQDLANEWNKAGQKAQIAVQYRLQSAQAFEAKPWSSQCEDDDSRRGVSLAFQNSADTLAQRAEYLLKAQEAQVRGDLELAHRWNSAAEKALIAVNYWTQSAEAYAAENQCEGRRCWNPALYTQEAADALAQSIKYWVNAQEARAIKSNELADEWTKTAQQFQKLAEYKTQSAEAYAHGSCDYENGEWYADDSLDSIVYAVQAVAKALAQRAECLAKIQEAGSRGNKKLIETWGEVANKLQVII